MSSSVHGFAGPVIYLDTVLPYALLRSVDLGAKDFFERIERGLDLASNDHHFDRIPQIRRFSL